MHDSCILEIGHRMWSIAAFAEKKNFKSKLQVDKLNFGESYWTPALASNSGAVPNLSAN